MFLRGIRGEADRNGDRYVTGLELGEFLGEMVVNCSKKPSRILDGLRQIAIAFGYIDINPVRASLVAHPWEWRYGGCWHDNHGSSTMLVCKRLRRDSHRLLLHDHYLESLPESLGYTLEGLDGRVSLGRILEALIGLVAQAKESGDLRLTALAAEQTKLIGYDDVRFYFDRD
jgi:hypothetical protein